MEVLKTVARSENLGLPDAFAARLVAYSGRNLRRCEGQGRVCACVCVYACVHVDVCMSSD